MLYPWLENNWRQLAAYLSQRRLPQALLIHGQRGVGKLHLAESFAQAMLCEQLNSEFSACGICHGCRLFKAQTHPDYIFIEPEYYGKAIGIDSIRRLITKLALKPQYPLQRCVVINSADSLNDAAANAFLKSLEEPTERTTIVLITEKTAKLPATIRSRCQLMAVTRPDSAMALDWLGQQHRNQGKRLLRMAHGAPLLAKKYAERDVLSAHDAYFNEWLLLSRGRASVTQIAEKWYKQEQSVAMNDVLTWMWHWSSTIIKYCYQPDCDIEPDDALQELSNRLDLKQLYQFYDLLLVSMQTLDTPLNKQLMIEQILIEWSRLNRY